MTDTMETGPSTSNIITKCTTHQQDTNTEQSNDYSTSRTISSAILLGMARTSPGDKEPLQSSVNGKTKPAMAPYLCARCNVKIVDRYLLEALDKYWHEECLKCDVCGCRLCDMGTKLYFKNNSILCQRDYLRIFRPNGTCAACGQTIPAFEQVMKAGPNVYHLECFACQECHQRFCIGDKFYLDLSQNKILCEYDYEERILFTQMTYSFSSLAQLKRQVGQQGEEFEEMQPLP